MTKMDPDLKRFRDDYNGERMSAMRSKKFKKFKNRLTQTLFF